MIFEHLIETYDSNLNMDIETSKEMTKKDKEVVDKIIDDFMFINNIKYDNLICINKYDKKRNQKIINTLIDSIEKRLGKNYIKKIVIFDTLLKYNKTVYFKEKTLFE